MGTPRAAIDHNERKNMTINLAIVYYSSTGYSGRIAQEIGDAAETAHIPVASPDDLEWADAVIFGTPTRFGNVAAQLKQFLDSLGGMWAQGKLADKVYSGFVTTSTNHGGQESTLLALYNSIHHFGGILVAPGFTDPVKFVDGNPYGTSHIDAQGTNPIGDQTRNAARHQAERIVRFTSALKAGSIR
jgi:NAD(P)H dehydrogenase (quinone)